MEKAEVIKKIPLFKGLADEDIEKLSKIAGDKSYMAGSEIFSEGSQGDALYAVKSGTVRVMKNGKDGEEEVSRMGPGQHFGEMAIIDGSARSATVDALEPTELYYITREDLENLLAEDDAMGHRVYRAFSGYLSARLRQTTSDLTFARSLVKRRER